MRVGTVMYTYLTTYVYGVVIRAKGQCSSGWRQLQKAQFIDLR